MSNVDMVLDFAAIKDMLRNDSGIHAALSEAASPALARNISESNAAAMRYTREGLTTVPYAMEVRVLESTSAAVIHSTNKFAAMIGRENGLPHW